MVKIDIAENRVRVVIPLDHYFQQNLDAVKAVGGGRYQVSETYGKHHHFPLTRLGKVMAAFPNGCYGKELSAYVERLKRAAELKAMTEAPQPVGIMVKLRRLQAVDVQFLSTLPRCILANPVGTGKTFAGICYAMNRRSAGLHNELNGVLVVTKSSGKYDYRAAILACVPGARVVIIDGRDGWFPPAGSVDFVVLNYDILSFRLEQIKAFKFAAVVFSEAHKLKGVKPPKKAKDGTEVAQGSQRGNAGLEISSFVPNILMETASLKKHRNSDVFPLLQILGYVSADDYYPWHIRYCGTTKTLMGEVVNYPAEKKRINRRGVMRYDFSGSSYNEELHEALAPFTVSRSKAEMLPDLPEHSCTPIPVDIDNYAEYRAAQKNFLKWLAEEKGLEAVERAKRAQAITKLGALLQLSAIGKVSAIIELLESYVDAEEKVVVFSSYRAPLVKLFEKFPELSVTITGDDSPVKKDMAVKRFQDDPSTLLCLCSTEAGGESINLQHACHTCLFVTLPWSPMDFEQAYGRCHRDGQRFPVQSIVPIARQTVEVDQVESLYGKAIDISKVLSASDRSENTESLRKILAALG